MAPFQYQFTSHTRMVNLSRGAINARSLAVGLDSAVAFHSL